MKPHNDSLKGWHILTVDDEADSLIVLTVLLEMASVTVSTASHGKAALEWLASNPLPDLIITDLSMPIMTGWELLEGIKANPAMSELSVFAFSAHAMQSDRQKAAEVGFAQYMTKPLDPMTFVDDLVKLIQQTPALANRLKSSII